MQKWWMKQMYRIWFSRKVTPLHCQIRTHNWSIQSCAGISSFCEMQFSLIEAVPFTVCTPCTWISMFSFHDTRRYLYREKEEVEDYEKIVIDLVVFLLSDNLPWKSDKKGPCGMVGEISRCYLWFLSVKTEFVTFWTFWCDVNFLHLLFHSHNKFTSWNQDKRSFSYRKMKLNKQRKNKNKQPWHSQTQDDIQYSASSDKYSKL